MKLFITSILNYRMIITNKAKLTQNQLRSIVLQGGNYVEAMDERIMSIFIEDSENNRTALTLISVDDSAK